MVNPDFPHHEYRWRGGARSSFIARAAYDRPVKGCDVCEGHTWMVSLAMDEAGESEAFWSGSIETQDADRPPSAATIWEAMIGEMLFQLKYCCRAAPEAVAVEGTKGMSDTEAVLSEIMDERRRQVEEKGYRCEHDDAHTNGQLARAAAAYALAALPFGSSEIVVKKVLHARGKLPPGVAELLSPNLIMPGAEIAEGVWPLEWDDMRSRPEHSSSERLRLNLICAAALAVAEIERIDRATGDGQ